MHCSNISSSSTRGILVLTLWLSKYVYSVHLHMKFYNFSVEITGNVYYMLLNNST